MLEFNIRNQEISRIDNFSPAEKSVEYLIAKFNFKTEDWNSAIKRAIFRNVKTKVEKDTMIEDDSCIVPWEVLEGSGDIEISVHGVIGTKEITTDVAVFNLNRTLQGGSATQEPSPTVYEQMLEMVKDAKEVAQSVRDDADNGKFSGIPGEKGEDGKSAYQYAVEGGFKGTEQEFIDSMGTAGGVDLTGFITKEEHEAELLKAMVKVTTDKSAFHHITDSANYRILDFGMEGLTEQRTTSGKNLFNANELSTEFCTVSGDVITATGKNISTQLNIVCKENTEYFIIVQDMNVIDVGNAGNSSFYGIQITAYYTDGTKRPHYITTPQYKYTFGKTGLGIERIEVNNPWGVKVEYTNLMITESTNDTTYEPFTNGPTPNPTHRQEIKLAGVLNEETGRYEHKCCVGNVNFMHLDNLIEVTGNPPIMVNDDEISITFDSTYNNRVYHIDVPPYTDLILSAEEISGMTVYISLENYKLGGTGVRAQITSSGDRQIINTKEHTKLALVFSNIGHAGTCKIKKLSVRAITNVGDWQPHASQPFTLTSDRPLTKWDKLVKRDGVWGHSFWSELKYTNVTEGDLGGNGNSTDSYYRFYVYGIHAYKGAECVCNIAKNSPSQWNGNYCGFWWDNNFCMMVHRKYVGYTEEDTYKDILQKFRDNVLSKGITVYYKTQTEKEFIPLPDEEQTLLNNLETYYGVTNVYNEQGCPMWLTYVADQELHWNQKLLQIQQAII